MKFKLGKGLQSLIPNKKEELKKGFSARGGAEKTHALNSIKENIFNIEVSKIKPNPNQPRQEIDQESIKYLADSIKEHGILQPLVLTKVIKETSRGQDAEYHLIAGHRRLAAAKLLNLPHVPAIIRSSNNQEKLELALVENLQREDLNPIEKAKAFQKLHEEFSLSHAEIARKVGKSREAIVNTMRLLNLPREIQTAVLANQVSEGHVRSLINIKDEEIKKSLLNEIINNRLSVREVEQKARELKTAVARKQVFDPKFKKIAQKMQDHLGLKVSLIKSGLGGKIVIRFADKENLEMLIKKLLSR